jgi:EpsI family protein
MTEHMTDRERREQATTRPVALSRRESLIGGALLAAAAAGLALAPRERQNMLGKAKLDDLVPKAFAGWRFDVASGLVLPPADQLRDKIYSQLLTRVYVREGSPPMMLLIAFSGAQDCTVQVHRPEICYPASGFRLTRIAEHTVPLAPGITVPARAITAESEVRREQLIYWTRVGSHFPTRWSQQRSSVIAENFAGIVPDGVLVRISAAVNGDAVPMLDRFAQDLYAAVGPHMRRVLLGPDLGGPEPGGPKPGGLKPGGGAA